MKQVFVLHDFDGKPYFKALETVANVTYLNTRPFRFLLRDLFKYKKVQAETIQSLLFFFKMPFVKDKVILLGMAPFNYRMLIYGWLYIRNKMVLHTSWHEWNGAVPFNYSHPLKSVLKKAWRYFLTRFACTVAVTQQTANSFSTFLPDVSDRVLTIPHVVDIERISEKKLKDKWQGQALNFLFTGRLTQAKGVNQYLQLAEFACQQGNGFKFHIAGRGELEQNILGFMNTHANLYFHGFISDRKQLKELMAQSHILLLPSRRTKGWEELFGLVVIEAMSQGCVVIASDHIGPSEIITHEVDGMLTHENKFFPTVKLVIDQIGVDRLKYFNYAQRAVMTSEKYSLDKVSLKWSAMLENL